MGKQLALGSMVKFIKSIIKLLVVILLVISITLNVAMFVGGAIYQVASSAFRAVTGIRTVAMQHADKVASLTTDLGKERVAKKQLRGELADATTDLSSERAASRKLRVELTDSTTQLSLERTTTKKLRSELSDTSTDLVTFRGKKVAIKEAVGSTADRISRRAVTTSSREVGAMAGEAIPYIGTAVIVGVTALELKDLCDTLKDMDELRSAFDPDMKRSEDRKTVCAMEVPSREELWAIAKASPEKAWTSARDAVPTLEEIKSFDFPDIDWAGTYRFIAGGAGTAWEATKSGAETALDKSTETTGGWMESVKNRWGGDEPMDERE